MTVDQTDQGENFVLPGAERISEREAMERRMAERTKSKKPQKAFESCPLFSGLAPHQDDLFK